MTSFGGRSGFVRSRPRIWAALAVLALALVACDGSDPAITATPSPTAQNADSNAIAVATTAESTPTVIPARLPGPGIDIIVLTAIAGPTASTDPTSTSVAPASTKGTPDAGSTATPLPPTPVTVPTPTTAPATPTALPDTSGGETPNHTVIPDPTTTPTSTATPAVPPSPTPTSAPVPTFAPLPDPTSTPTPPSNLRFGVISGGPLTSYRLGQLGVDWYIDYSPDPGTAPPGTTKLPFISVKPGKARLTPSEITSFTRAAPGSTWYIGGEPNIEQQDGISPQAYVVEFDYYATQIRAADPTAKIMGPSILNWDFTCTGCSGFQSGESWMREFVDAYIFFHDGASPPVDIWAIDVYPLTWNNLPMTNWQIVRDQLIGFREYLKDEVPGHANTPIWITEVASHWGFDGFEFEDGKMTIPAGQSFQDDFLWAEVIGYMDGIIGWLQDNADAQNIGRWFFYRDWVDISQSAGAGYAGIQFFESGESGAALNQLGQVYREYATGQR